MWTSFNTNAVISRRKTQFRYIFNERVAVENGKPRARELLEQYHECCQLLHSKQFVAVLANGGDLSALVQAPLAETFPWVKGPSVESVFLCWNKHYSRKIEHRPEYSLQNTEFRGRRGIGRSEG